MCTYIEPNKKKETTAPVVNGRQNLPQISACPVELASPGKWPLTMCLTLQGQKKTARAVMIRVTKVMVMISPPPPPPLLLYLPWVPRNTNYK